MALNKSKGNMYDFITHTWNPLAGECTHGCQYCSTNKLKKRYPAINSKYSGNLRLVEKELKTNLGKDNFIFVCAQNDLFAPDVSPLIIQKILSYCKSFDNKYLFQTKNSFRLNEYFEYDFFPENSIFCTTVETNRFYKEWMGKTPRPD